MTGQKIVTAIAQFLREVRIETKKVTWPTRKETLAATVVVLIFSILIGLYLGFVDLGLTELIKLVIK